MEKKRNREITFLLLLFFCVCAILLLLPSYDFLGQQLCKILLFAAQTVAFICPFGFGPQTKTPVTNPAPSTKGTRRIRFIISSLPCRKHKKMEKKKKNVFKRVLKI